MLELSSNVVHLLPGYALKLAVAFLCGLILGIERESKDKPAGLRTIILITVGSTLYMIVSELMAVVTGGSEDTTVVDPSRIAAQVVSGIGFLGAGAIIQSRGAVRGLTTAAVIWVAAAIGLCTGAGFPILALAVTLVVVLSITVMQPIRTFLDQRGPEVLLEGTAPNDSLVLKKIELYLLEQDVPRDHFTFNPLDESTIHFAVRLRGSNGAVRHVLDALTHIDGVHGTRVPPAPPSS